MPFNGSGTFNRLYNWAVDASNNINILSSKMDAEMNGMAAGLTNCITRDGQSPPSADIPWGGKKITNLGLATVSTDALSQAAGDARYLLQSLTSLALGGSFSATSGAFSGNVTVGGTLVVTGVISTSGGAFNATDGTAPGLNLIKTGANAGTASIINTGSLQMVAGAAGQLGIIRADTIVLGNQTLSITYVTLTSTGLASAVAITCPTPTAGDNSTKAATTAFVAASFAPLASPALTGTPTAPTAAAGTATTQLATTAFVDALRDVPSNAKAASYALALTDRGGGVDFNGTSLTCTIPANGSVAFPVGTTIVLTNVNASGLSIAITTDTLTLAGTTTTGTRTLAQNGMATLRKITSTSWLISGAGLS